MSYVSGSEARGRGRSVSGSGLGGTSRAIDYKEASDIMSQDDVSRGPVSTIAAIAPPGYSGYIPGVYAGNVFGHTFARANKHAAKDLDSYRRGSQPKFDPPSRRSPPGPNHPGYSHGAQIPGYAGFVSGVYAGNLIATCTPRAAKANWCPLTDGPRPKVEKLKARHD